MCNRYQLNFSFEQLAKELDAILALESLEVVAPAEGSPGWAGSYNIKPTQDVPVVRRIDGAVRLEPLHWGWRPPTPATVRSSDGKKKPDEYFNARAETIERFGGAYGRGQSCLIPMTGFWEWGPDKQPRAIQARGGELLCFGGLWLPTTTRQGVATTGCVIVTTTPNGVMAPIHNRMPVILPREQWQAWLETPGREFLQPAPEDLLHAWRVARFGIQADGVALLQPAAPVSVASGSLPFE